MFTAINFAIKYKHVLPILIDFVDTVLTTSADKQLTKEERSKLMKQYWVLVKAIQNTK